MSLSSWAGKSAEPSMLVNVPRLMIAYYTHRPDPAVPEPGVVFGTSGHRGSAFEHSFNAAHILAMSRPSACTVSRIISMDRFSWASTCMRCRRRPLPLPLKSWRQTGFNYNPPHGDPADTHVTDWLQRQANAILSYDLKGVKRLLFERAQRASTTHRYNYMDADIDDLMSVLDIEALRNANLNLGVDPLGGSGVHHWERISDPYQLPLTVVNDAVDPTFRFMSLD